MPSFLLNTVFFVPKDELGSKGEVGWIHAIDIFYMQVTLNVCSFRVLQMVINHQVIVVVKEEINDLCVAWMQIPF